MEVDLKEELLREILWDQTSNKISLLQTSEILSIITDPLFLIAMARSYEHWQLPDSTGALFHYFLANRLVNFPDIDDEVMGIFEEVLNAKRGLVYDRSTKKTIACANFTFAYVCWVRNSRDFLFQLLNDDHFMDATAYYELFSMLRGPHPRFIAEYQSLVLAVRPCIYEGIKKLLEAMAQEEDPYTIKWYADGIAQLASWNDGELMLSLREGFQQPYMFIKVYTTVIKHNTQCYSEELLLEFFKIARSSNEIKGIDEFIALLNEVFYICANTDINPPWGLFKDNFVIFEWFITCSRAGFSHVASLIGFMKDKIIQNSNYLIFIPPIAKALFLRIRTYITKSNEELNLEYIKLIGLCFRRIIPVYSYYFSNEFVPSIMDETSSATDENKSTLLIVLNAYLEADSRQSLWLEDLIDGFLVDVAGQDLAGCLQNTHNQIEFLYIYKIIFHFMRSKNYFLRTYRNETKGEPFLRFYFSELIKEIHVLEKSIKTEMLEVMRKLVVLFDSSVRISEFGLYPFIFWDSSFINEFMKFEQPCIEFAAFLGTYAMNFFDENNPKMDVIQPITNVYYGYCFRKFSDRTESWLQFLALLQNFYTPQSDVNDKFFLEFIGKAYADETLPKTEEVLASILAAHKCLSHRCYPKLREMFDSPLVKRPPLLRSLLYMVTFYFNQHLLYCHNFQLQMSDIERTILFVEEGLFSYLDESSILVELERKYYSESANLIFYACDFLIKNRTRTDRVVLVKLLVEAITTRYSKYKQMNSLEGLLLTILNGMKDTVSAEQMRSLLADSLRAMCSRIFCTSLDIYNDIVQTIYFNNICKLVCFISSYYGYNKGFDRQQRMECIYNVVADAYQDFQVFDGECIQSLTNIIEAACHNRGLRLYELIMTHLMGLHFKVSQFSV